MLGFATFHQAKGREASRVVIAQPNLSPMPERLAKGGWQAHEELCLKFISETRGKDTLQYLPHLEDVSRGELLSLWAAPPDLSLASQGPVAMLSASQETDVTTAALDESSDEEERE